MTTPEYFELTRKAIGNMQQRLWLITQNWALLRMHIDWMPPEPRFEGDFDRFMTKIARETFGPSFAHIANIGGKSVTVERKFIDQSVALRNFAYHAVVLPDALIYAPKNIETAINQLETLGLEIDLELVRQRGRFRYDLGPELLTTIHEWRSGVIPKIEDNLRVLLEAAESKRHEHDPEQSRRHPMSNDEKARTRLGLI